MGLRVRIVDAGPRELNIMRRVSHHVFNFEGEPYGEIETVGKEIAVGDGESQIILIEATRQDPEYPVIGKSILIDDIMIVGSLDGGHLVLYDRDEGEHIFKVPAGDSYSLYHADEDLRELLGHSSWEDLPNEVREAFGIPLDEFVEFYNPGTVDLYSVILEGF